MKVDDLPTQVPKVDPDVVERNAEKMQESVSPRERDLGAGACGVSRVYAEAVSPVVRR